MMVLHGGHVYTVDSAQPWAEAITIEAGKIVAVGSADEVLSLAVRTTEIVDLAGRMVLPGFHDPHVHVVEAGVNERLCLFPWRRPLAAYEQPVRNCANRQQSRDWVVGAGVFVAALLEGGELPIDMLDRAVPDRPVLILDDLGHGAWANTMAMEAAGYRRDDPDPPGGILHRDAVSGRLTGIVFENAQQKLRDAAWPPTEQHLDETYQGLIGSLAELNMHGITSVSDAGGYWTRGHHEVWKRAEQRGELTVRASNALYVFPDRPFDTQIADLQRMFANEPGRLLRFNQAKIYIDGILDLGTSALLEPYIEAASPPSPSPAGFVYFQQDELEQYVSALDAIGFQLQFHATGNRGVRLALDAVEKAQARNAVADRRHRVTHLYLVDEADRGRFLDLGVIADLQMPPDAVNRAYTHYVSRLVVLSEEVVHNGAPLRLNGVVQRPQRPQREHPMRLHGNAKTAPYTRELMVRRVLKQAEPVRDTAAAFGVSKTTLYKWLRRYREDGVAGLEDRSSRPHTSPRQTPAGVVHRILKLRRHRLTAWEISAQLSVPASTVSQWLRRQGVGRLRDLEPKPPVQRYERASPGEILHLDTKKLARIVRPGHRVHGDLARKSRGAGWEFAHVAVDDHSRVAYVQVMTKEDQYTCTEFLERAVAFFNARGVSIQRVMTDNGGGYISKRFNSACRKHRIGHLYTRPYTPRTNGKAERFIRTLKERWAYYRSYRTSAHRTRALVPWLNHYNRHRPHAGIGKRPPMSRLRSSS